MSIEAKTIIIDIDEKNARIGIAGEQQPSASIETKVGSVKNSSISDLISYEETIREAFSKINVDPKKTPVLITETAISPKVNRERIASILFDRVNVPSIFIGYREVMAMYACGYLNGIGVYVCSNCANVVPVVNGNAVHERKRTTKCDVDSIVNLIIEVQSSFEGKAGKDLKTVCIFGEVEVTGIVEELKKRVEDVKIVSSTGAVGETAWMGASTLAANTAFPGLSIPFSSYEIDGMSAIHAKLF